MLIDGMDNNERAIGTIVVRPSIDAIAEVRVQTSNYPAEVGRTAGGVVNMLTKAGTNTLHGTVYGFWRDDQFDSRDYFATVDPLLKQKQFGGSIGGPLVRDRTFYFADYEGFRSRQGQVNVLTVPTARMRTRRLLGDRPGHLRPDHAAAVSRQRDSGEPHRSDRGALHGALSRPDVSGLANNYSSTTLRTQNSTTADARIDHRFSDNNSVWGRFSINDSHTVTPPGCPPVNGIHGNCLTGANAGFPGPNDTDAKALQVNYVRIFNPTMVGEFKAGYMKVGIFSYPSNYQSNVSEQFGLRGVNIDDLASGLALQNIVGLCAAGRHAEHPAHQPELDPAVQRVDHQDDRARTTSSSAAASSCGSSASCRVSSRTGCGRTTTWSRATPRGRAGTRWPRSFSGCRRRCSGRTRRSSRSTT